MVNDRVYLVRLAGTTEEPYFCGKDVCEVLGYKDPQKALFSNVKPKYKKDLKALFEVQESCSCTSLGPFEPKLSYNEGKAVYISEPGLYGLIMASRAPYAEVFQEHVLETILPSIRRYGSYQANQQLEEVRAQPMWMLWIKDHYMN